MSNAGQMTRFFRLFDDIDIPRRWHLGKVFRGPRGATDLLNGVLADESPLDIEVTHFGRPLQFCLTSFAVPVATTPLGIAVSNVAGRDVQLISATVGADKDFSVLNCTRVVSCLDETRSDFVKWSHDDHRPDLVGQYKAVRKLSLSGNSIPRDANIFRIDGWHVVLVVSNQVRQSMREVGCFGAKFLPLPIT